MFRIMLIPLCALVISLQVGCANVQRVLPAEFNLGHAHIDAATVEPAQVSPGPHGKVAGAVVVGTVGAVGVGLGTGIITALPCFCLGPLAAPCFATVVPAMATGAAVGGVSGAAIGAAEADRADSPEQTAAKHELLDTALARLNVRELLIDRLQRRTRESTNIELPVVDPKTQDATATWRIAIETIYIAPAWTGSDDPYALLASASITVREASSGATAFHRCYQALSPEKRTTAEWGNDNAAAILTALDGLIYALADQMFCNLSRGDGVLWTYTHYKKEFFSRATSAIITNVDGTEHYCDYDGRPIQLPPGQHLVEVKYLRQSYIPGVLGWFEFEQERRSFELHVEAGHSYMPFARRHCDKDWMGIVDTGKSAKDDHTSWEDIGFWQFGDLTRDASTHVVVAGELPPVTCEDK